MSVKDKAMDFVLGGLSPDERASVSVERLYHPALDSEINDLEHIYSGAIAGENAGAPLTGVWARIQNAVEQSEQALARTPFQMFPDGDWQPHGPGIEFKPLWSDKTILIRCIPGGAEEAHDQPDDDDEHIIVIAGDLNMGGRSFKTGDYLCVPAGTMHPRMTSSGGCILFTQYMEKRV
jgi:ChrR Cupin-like domain